MNARTHMHIAASGATYALLLVLAVIFLSTGSDAAARTTMDYSRIGYQTDVLFVDGSKNSCRLGDFFSETRFSTSHAGFTGNLELLYVVPSENMTFGYFGSPDSAPHGNSKDDGRLSGRLVLQPAYVRTGLTVISPREYASAGVRLRISDGQVLDAIGTLSILSLTPVRLSLSYGLYQPVPAEAVFRYYPYSGSSIVGIENASIDLDTRAFTDEIKSELQLTDQIHAEGSARIGRFAPQRPSDEEMPTDNYTGHVYGKWFDTHLQADYSFGDKSSIGLGFSRVDLNVDSLLGLAGGRTFAYFGAIEGNCYDWELSFKLRRWHANLSVGSVRGRVAGVVQGWPFLDDIYHFLGERRHLRASGRLDWVHLSTDVDLMERHWNWLGLTTHLAYLAAEPQFEYSSWRPILLGMGYDDYRAGSLEIRRADLVRIGLSPSVTCGDWRFVANISQWLPISVNRFDSTPNSANPDISSSNSNDGDGWGGLSVSLSLQMSFD